MAKKKPAPRTARQPAEKPGVTISGCAISLGQFTPSDEHCQAVKALADAAAENARAINALSATLSPPAIHDAIGIKIGG